MAVSGKYGRIAIEKIDDGEPVFLLRAQDKLAVHAIEMYRALAASHGSPVADGIEDELEAFRRWEGAKKIPD